MNEETHYIQSKEGLKKVKGSTSEAEKEQRKNLKGDDTKQDLNEVLAEIGEKALEEKAKREKPTRDREAEAEAYQKDKEEKREKALKEIERVEKEGSERRAIEKLLRENPELTDALEDPERRKGILRDNPEIAKHFNRIEDKLKEKKELEERIQRNPEEGYLTLNQISKMVLLDKVELMNRIESERVKGKKDEITGEILIRKDEVKRLLS